mmetsp:Transcript_5052/g.16941  ORF Transcript_5052/g.16941 Transcript_5052/m.16941 type:complete len:219 (+) Transcript_5052:292-948(+)
MMSITAPTSIQSSSSWARRRTTTLASRARSQARRSGARIPLRTTSASPGRSSCSSTAACACAAPSRPRASWAPAPWSWSTTSGRACLRMAYSSGCLTCGAPGPPGRHRWARGTRARRCSPFGSRRMPCRRTTSSCSSPSPRSASGPRASSCTTPRPSALQSGRASCRMPMGPARAMRPPRRSCARWRRSTMRTFSEASWASGAGPCSSRSDVTARLTV